MGTTKYSGKIELILWDTRPQIMAINEVRYKYTSKGIKANPKDFYRGTTSPYYFELIKNMGI